MRIFQRQHIVIGSPELRGACVPELVARRATENPGSLALTAGDDTLTYGALNARANQLASYLRSRGVGADVPVGICLARSLDLVVAALGVLKAGGAYIPMDPAYPPDRLAFMLEDAQAPVLISNRRLAQCLATGERELVDVADPRITAQRPDVVPNDIAPAHLAYIVYTSGSTGTPKGVEVTHGNLANLVSWHAQSFSVTRSDRASHLAGLGFDATVWELWPYLAVGASVHLADEDTRNSPDLLREWLLAQQITIGFVPTPLAERLLAANAGWPRGCKLRVLLTGGDALHTYPPNGLPFTLVNNYGPTECTVVATSGLVQPNASPKSPPPIGRAITDTQIHLLDESLTPVPDGSTGEIYIGGAGVARGYCNRPDLTAEKFIPDPFVNEAGRRLYRTGDLARRLPDGQIAFLGRSDDQIKIRGYRIEPGEVSSALNRHPDIQASIAVAREDTPDERRLVAYVVVDAAAELTHTAVRDFLRESLPEYMLPAMFVRLDALPLTPHGKIDRVMLPVPIPLNTLQDEVSAAPRTDTERRVVKIIAELLKLETVGLDDNFFLLGGHSLLGAQLIARLRDAFGVQITLRGLFESPTVEALSAKVDSLVESGDTSNTANSLPTCCSPTWDERQASAMAESSSIGNQP